jgi:hypothetical protein
MMQLNEIVPGRQGIEIVQWMKQLRYRKRIFVSIKNQNK